MEVNRGLNVLEYFFVNDVISSLVAALPESMILLDSINLLMLKASP